MKKLEGRSSEPPPPPTPAVNDGVYDCERALNDNRCWATQGVINTLGRPGRASKFAYFGPQMATQDFPNWNPNPCRTPAEPWRPVVFTTPLLRVRVTIL